MWLWLYAWLYVDNLSDHLTLYIYLTTNCDNTQPWLHLLPHLGCLGVILLAHLQMCTCLAISHIRVTRGRYFHVQTTQHNIIVLFAIQFFLHALYFRFHSVG